MQRPNVFDLTMSVRVLAQRSADRLSDDIDGERTCAIKEAWMYHARSLLRGVCASAGVQER